MGIFEFKLPELGEGLHEGKIERWLVKPGDMVEEDDAIAEVENDKAVVEMSSPVSGKVIKIMVEAGTTAVVGDILLTFEVEGEGNAATTAAADPAAKDDANARPEPTAAAATPQAATVPTAPAMAPAASAAVTPATGPQAQATQATDASAAVSHAHEVLATPGVRKFAREQGVDITSIQGTGAHGKITKEDVETFLKGGTGAVVSAAQPAEQPSAVATATPPDAATTSAHIDPATQEERVPLTSIRKIIAQAMAKSAYTAPHVTLMDEVNVTELVNLRKEIKPIAADRGVKITYLPFIVKALCAALREFPQLNASLDEERQELVLKHYYHIGIATDTERGLVVPVVKDADRKSMWTIASEIEDMATRARTNKLTPAEMKGSTISITNIGSAGGMFFTPIINYPEVAILGVGRITEKPIMKDGNVVGAHLMALSLSFDHRIIDGALAQNFVNALKRLLESPKMLLMEV